MIYKEYLYQRNFIRILIHKYSVDICYFYNKFVVVSFYMDKQLKMNLYKYCRMDDLDQ